MLKKIIKYVTDPDCRFRVNASQGMYKDMPDDLYLERIYKARTGRTLDLQSPKSFNEKLQWLKLHDRNPAYCQMVDKYEVKKYVSERIGSDYIIPSYGVWDLFDQIDFDALPGQFVLKCTHDSGGLVICKDKNTFDRNKAKKKIERSLKRNYFYQSREWPYKDLKPRVLAEKYMVDESGTELKDYKVLCFDGQPKLIELHQGRFTGTHYQDFYDTEWNKLTMSQFGEKAYPEDAPRPACFSEMLELSAKLSNDIPHVRVDWYIIHGKLYFGELTFYDASGFDLFQEEKDDLLLGSWITKI